jgi:DNA-binding NarL/FixJ family response regulator
MDVTPSSGVAPVIRLLIADRAATRLGMRVALEGKVEICAEVDNAEQAIRAAKLERPDACLIAWELTGGGCAAVRGITRAAPNAAVVVLADESDPEAMLEAVRAGAVGYVPGSVSVDRLHKIIQAVSANEAVLPRVLVRDLLFEVRASGNAVDGLTGREVQVLGMLRRGHSTAMIARRLEIAPVTVRRHISELVRKLGVEDRSDLVDDGRDQLALT